MASAVTIVLGSHVPATVATAVTAYLAQTWPTVSWRVMAVDATEGVATTPSVALLGEEDVAPSADPAELGIVWWQTAAENGEELSAALRAALHAHIGRLLASRLGDPPARTQALPSRLTRADLFRLPHSVPQPLAAAPRVAADPLCLHAIGCAQCTTVCPSAAIVFSDNVPAIDPVACLHCGSCVAVCPTGTLQSAACGDRQWQGLIEGLMDAPAEPPIVIGCAQDAKVADRSNIRVEVACLGELGWHPLWLLAAAGLTDRVALICPNPTCIRYHAAVAANARWQRIRSLMAQRAPESDTPYTADPAESPLHADWRWPELVDAVRQATRSIPAEALAEWAEPTFGYRVTLATDTNRACTLCAVCAHRCPTQALRIAWDRDDATRRLQFDASRCLGCSACTTVCPERVLHVGVDNTAMALLPANPAILVTDDLLVCQGCGAPLESATFIRRLTDQLRERGYREDALKSLNYCPACKDRQSFGTFV